MSVCECVFTSAVQSVFVSCICVECCRTHATRADHNNVQHTRHQFPLFSHLYFTSSPHAFTASHSSPRATARASAAFYQHLGKAEDDYKHMSKTIKSDMKKAESKCQKARRRASTEGEAQKVAIEIAQTVLSSRVGTTQYFAMGCACVVTTTS
jgi:hypothetical protein